MMKGYICSSIIVLVIVICLSQSFHLEAQDFSLWNNIRNSAYTKDNDLHIRSEIVSPFGNFSEFFYSQGEGWQQDSLINVGQETYEAVIPIDPQKKIICRYRTEVTADEFDIPLIVPGISDTLVIMMPGYITQHEPPVDLDILAKVADDPVGDVADNVPGYLDITGNYFSYSDTHFHAAMLNNHHSFPTGAMFGPYNFYANLIINPEAAVTDTVFYGMIYANVLNIITPGLYRFSGVDIGDMGRIGDITYNETDDALFMSANIEDMISDPYFGDWPNISNSLLILPVTMRIGRELEFELTDTGKISVQYFDKYVIEPFENNLPVLSNKKIKVSNELITVSIDYFDKDGNFPVISRLLFDAHSQAELGNEQGEVNLHPQSFDFREPVRFEAVFPEKNFTGIVQFSDNGYQMVELPIKLSAEEDYLAATAAGISAYPNPLRKSRSVNKIYISVTSGEPYFCSPGELNIFNIKGQHVRRLQGDHAGNSQGGMEQGRQHFVWDCLDYRGRQVSAGIYFIRVDGSSSEKAGKIMIVR